MTRQARWQRRKIAAGLCRQCGRRKRVNASHCRRCRQAKRIADRNSYRQSRREGPGKRGES